MRVAGFLLERSVSIDEAKVNCLTNAKTSLSSWKKSINKMLFILK